MSNVKLAFSHARHSQTPQSRLRMMLLSGALGALSIGFLLGLGGYLDHHEPRDGNQLLPDPASVPVTAR